MLKILRHHEARVDVLYMLSIGRVTKGAFPRQQGITNICAIRYCGVVSGASAKSEEAEVAASLTDRC